MAQRTFYISRKPAIQRKGPHTYLFKQILTGFLLGDGWLEKHGLGVRLGISLITKFEDVAQWYTTLLYGLGYINQSLLPKPLCRNRKNVQPYYQIRTFSFSSLEIYRNEWYGHDRNKVLPNSLRTNFTPLCLAVWVMGDGSGIKDGGFKISSHSFTKEQNQQLVYLFFEMYQIESKVCNEGSRGLYFIRIYKRSVPLLKNLIMPYLLPSCYYKFRFVK